MFRLKKSLWRTAILGMLALVALCYALIGILDISVYDTLLLVGTGIIIVLVLGIAGGAFGFLLFRWRSRSNKRD